MNKLFTRDFLEFMLVRSAMAWVNLFPIAVSTWLARRLGEAMFLVLAGRRKVALRNLSLAFGQTKSAAERRQIALESFRHLATSLMEFFRLPDSIQEIKQHVRFRGTEYLDRAFQRGKGVVLVMSHLGPWEYLGFLTYLKQYPTTVLGRPIRNPYFYRRVKELRKTVNLDYSDKTLGPRKLLEHLRQNHLVAITIDQWAGDEGLWIDFFALPTSTTSLPARLAQRTGCALVPAYCIRLASGEYEIKVMPEVALNEKADDPVAATTRELNRLLEKQISLFPQQWLWTHNRWKGRKLAK